VVERLAAEEGIRIRSRESAARVGRGKIQGAPVLLALPQTYMNASGEAVHALCNANGIDIHDLCVVVDDIDLPLGVLRMRARGSAGGQKGLASVIAHLGTAFARLRVGIRGAAYSREIDLVDYVLAPHLAEEEAAFEETVGRATDALRVWLTEGIDAAMRRANVKPSSPRPASGVD
jgi:PTH1 family peptidyl-tRNA hydrolase